jgi:GT2 family glycosyltransferase
VNDVPPRLSAIIPSFNTAELTLACLQSILAKHWRFALELIVVDNASADGSPTRIAERFPNVRLIQLPRNLGYGAACNAAAAQATGDFLLFLNSDTEVQEGALDALLRTFGEFPEAAAVACHEVAPTGETVMGCRSHHTLRSAISFLSGYRLFCREGNRCRIVDWDRRSDRWVDNVTGFAWAIRHEMFDKLGGFDERLFLYCEEEDMALRLRQLDGRIRYVAAARIVHLGARSSRDLGHLGRRKRWLRSFVYLREKHGHSVSPVLDYLVLYPFLLLWWLGSRAKKTTRTPR